MSQRLLSAVCAAIIALTGGIVTALPATAASVSPLTEETAEPTVAVDAGVAAIGGAAVVGATLTAETSGWRPADVSLHYQWQRGGVAIPVATERQYTLGPEDLGQRISVMITGTAEGKLPATVAAEEISPVTAGRFSAPTPTVSGSLKVGKKLTARPGSWKPAATLTYQWLRSGQVIPEATTTTYTLTAADRGKSITVKISGNAPGYTSITKTSAATSKVQPGNLTSAPTPRISGKAVHRTTLTAKPGTWGPGKVALSYQWYRSGKAIKGATGPKYTLAAADVGKTITVKVTGKRSGYSAKSRTSTSTVRVLKRLTSTPTPKISGTVKVGSSLTARPGTWKPAKVTLRYQWYRSGTPIKGATSAKYKLAKADGGHKVTVMVTGKKSGYGSVAKTSAATKTVPRVLTATPAPKITGAKKVGSTLTAKAGTWKPAKVTLTYQWYRSGKAIKGATGSKYKLKPADVGKKITVKVTGKRSGYSTASKTSARTTKITYPSRTSPSSAWNCPSWAPIKGNANSMIYHVKGGAYYSRTKPEDCFATEKAARDAGYRRAKL